MSGALKGSGGWPRRAGAAAAVTFGVASCSLVLDFSGSAAPPDAGIPDAVQRSAACDTNEPNNALTEAVAVDPGTYELGLCDDDTSDFLAFDLAGGEDVQLSISFEYEAGRKDLELHLHNRASDTELDSAVATDGQASIERSAAQGNALPAGEYAVEVVVSAELTDPAPEILYELTVSY